MPTSFALLAGVFAILNPCGFAMLPAFLSFYVGADNASLPQTRLRALQGVVVGVVVSAGFLSVFSIVGLPVALGVGLLHHWCLGWALGLDYYWQPSQLRHWRVKN